MIKVVAHGKISKGINFPLLVVVRNGQMGNGVLGGELNMGNCV